MVRGDSILSQALAELVGYALGHPTRVHEDEGRAVGLDLFGDEVEDLGHLLRRGDGPELVIR
jgi:hypothetical protein